MPRKSKETKTMKGLLNNVNKGYLVIDRNRGRKPNEKCVYYSFWLKADKTLEMLFDFPEEGCYMFTKTEYERNIRHQASIADRRLFTFGDLNLFSFAKPTVLVKLAFEGMDAVVKIPINVLRNASNRAMRNPEDVKAPGRLNKIVDKISDKLK